MRSASLLVVKGALCAVLALSACEPVKLPQDMPGPAGCGMRDPRGAGPSVLSVAQQQALRDSGPPGAVEPNTRGGLSWMYSRNNGSVFGERETVEALVFDKNGILVDRQVEVMRQVGK